MTPRIGIHVVALALSVALLGCDDDEPRVRARPEAPVTSPPPPTSPAPPEVPSPGPVGDCPNAADVVSNPLNRIAGPLVGDVTGDATPERIYLSLDQAAPEGCQLFVVVSETASSAASVEGWDPSGGVPSPTLNSLVQIDGRPGAEIVVDLAAGASTRFVGAFSVAGGTIERISTSGDTESTATTNDLFAYGGSVGHLEAVDCTADGRVVLSSAFPRADRYRVSRRFFRPNGATLELQPDASRRAVVSLNDVEDFPEFSASPFGSCPPA